MLENNSEKQKSTLKGVLLILALLTFGGLLVAGIVKILALVCSAVLPLLEPLIALGLWGSVGYFAYRYFRKKEKPKEEAPEISPELVRLQTTGTPLVVGNPFRGIFVVGAAGSGKSESIAVPLLSEFVRLGYSGLVYDFKFPTLANDVESFLKAERSPVRHVYINFNNPSLDVNNPQNPAILTIGNFPTLAQTFAPLCSLVITVAIKLMNQPGKHPSFVMLDEAPTIFVPNLEILPNTGRSNHVATVLMCQDLAQLTDGYGKEKAEVLFAACNTHFYGRVSSSFTAERLSRQFGKEDKIYRTASQSQTGFYKTTGVSESVQERDTIKPKDFLGFETGEFAGIAVESNRQFFLLHFLQVVRPVPAVLEHPQTTGSPNEYYREVREEVRRMLAGQDTKPGNKGEKPEQPLRRPRFRQG